MKITITEEQFLEAVSKAQTKWDKAGTRNSDVFTSVLMLLQNLAFATLIKDELFKDDGEED